MRSWVFWLSVGPFVFIWWAVRDVIYYVFSPRDRFGIDSREAEYAFDQQQRIARILFVAAFLFWDPSRLLDGGVLLESLTGFAVGVALAAIALIPSWVIIVGAAKEHRLRTARLAALPLGVAGVGVLIVGSLLAAVYFLTTVGSNALSFREAVARLFLFACVTTALVAALWFGFRIAADGYFRAVDGHPFMRPLTLIILGLLLTGFGVIELDLQQESSTFPVWVSLLFAFLGPVAIGGLGFYEMKLLKDMDLRLGQSFDDQLRTLGGPRERPRILGGTRWYPDARPPADFGPPGVNSVSKCSLVVGAMLVLASGVVARASEDAPPPAEASTNAVESSVPATLASRDLLEGDLGLSRPIAPLACTGEFVVVLASAIVPGRYGSEVQAALDKNDEVAYLRTDTSCGAFDPDIDGNPIYVVYSGPYRSRQRACDVKAWVRSDAYVKRLDASASPNQVVDCGD